MSPSPVRILFVDDEERILRSLAMQFRRHYEVLTESDPRRALERLKTERIQVLVSDQRMPQMSGAELLAQARERYPETLRILLTGYSDLDAAVDALNDGGIFRYLTKPWNPQEMAFTLRQAAEIASRQGLPAPPAATLAAPLSVLLLDDDPETLDCVGAFCHAGGHRLLRARNLAEALVWLNTEPVEVLVSDLKLAGEHTAPLLKSLAQAHPRLLSLVVTPFRDTQALLERGAVEPSVGEVMGAAGLTVGGFYAHFQSKDALMLEAFEQLLGKRRELLGELDPGLSGKERRALAAAFYLSRKHRDAQVDAGCPLPATLAEVARLPEGFREVLSRHVEIMVASLAESPEETDVALADLVLMIGGLALARALGPGELSDRVLRAAKQAVN